MHIAVAKWKANAAISAGKGVMRPLGAVELTHLNPQKTGLYTIVVPRGAPSEYKEDAPMFEQSLALVSASALPTP